MLTLNHLTGFGAVGGGLPDPYWANVKLLIQPTSGDATIVDLGPGGKSLSLFGNAALSTTTPWGGAKSIAFDGSGDYITTADSDDWLFDGDFTIDVGYYDTSPTGSTLVGQVGAGGINSWGLWSYYVDYRPTLTLYNINGSSSAFVYGSNLGASLWQHVSIQRSGADVSMYQQFSRVATATVSGALFNSSYPLAIGSDSRGGPNPFSGYIAYIRITKGVARYSGATIPTLTGPLPTA